MIIGITGYAGVGKDAFAKSLNLRGGFDIRAFSDELHNMATILNPILSGIPNFGYATYNELVWMYGYTEAKRRFPQVRKYLQILGTECVRDMIGEDSWIRALSRKLNPYVNTVITGVRYPNEAQFVKSYNGLMIRIEREGFTPINNHTSDTSVDSIMVDKVIYNDAGLKELSDKAEMLLRELNIH